jgi:hypothetical protein
LHYSQQLNYLREYPFSVVLNSIQELQLYDVVRRAQPKLKVPKQIADGAPYTCGTDDSTNWLTSVKRTVTVMYHKNMRPTRNLVLYGHNS